MVRRWSCINNYNIDMNLFLKFHVFRRLTIFRNSLKFKRFWNEGTRFKRLRMMRLRHRHNWLVYLNIIKYWVQDVQFTKHHSRFQYFNYFFINNYIIFDGNYIKRQKLKLFMMQDQWVSAALTRRFFSSLGQFKNSRMLCSYPNANHVHAFFPADEIIPNIITLPVVAIFDLVAYGLNSDLEHEDDFETLTALLFTISCQQHIEIYKILSLLFYFKLFNKYLCFYVFFLFKNYP